MDIIKVHIWQLSEKLTDIDKSNEYIMIHDRISLKKVTMESLYEYFNQDYKIDNIVRYFENIIETYNKDYEVSYDSLELSIDEYANLIDDLVKKFGLNKDNIRSINNKMAIIDNDSKSITDNFDTVNNRIITLSDTFDIFNIQMSDIQIIITKDNDELIGLFSQKDELTDNISQLYISYGNIKDQISDISSHIETDIEDKKKSLIESINCEYDKIISIIDYYHHLHDD